MKIIFFVLLISFIFCIDYLSKYGKIKVNSISGLFYLKSDEFDEDSTINMQLNV